MKNTTPDLELPQRDDSDAQERAKLARARIERDGDASWPVAASDGNNPYDATDNSTSYSNYLFGNSGQSDKPLWSDTTMGRAWIRLISRGIVGAAAFTIGQRYARHSMLDYEFTPWKEFSAKKDRPWLHYVAYGFDSTFGKAFQGLARMAAPEHLKEEWAHEVVHFRHKGYYYRQPGHEVGRSFGHEVVGVTFDFAMASIGDATARNVIQAIDPNNVKPWYVDENGKPKKGGHFSLPEWGKAVGRATWRILSKNQGEDWVAAIPYVFQMKWQRQWLANRKPGFKISADNGWFGSSYAVDDQGRIVDDYNMSGAVDLHMRFVGYNWYTLMFREAYDSVANHFKQWKDSGYHISLPKVDNPIMDVADSVGSTARYVLKSFIKANIYMNPAVVPFWFMRVPQTKWKAGVLHFDPNHPEHNAIGARQAGHILTRPDRYTGETRFVYDTAAGRSMQGAGHFVNAHHMAPDQLHFNGVAGQPTLSISNPLKGRNPYDLKNLPHGPDYKPNWLNRSMNFMGGLSFKAGTAATKLSNKLPEGGFKDFLAGKNLLGKEPGYHADWEREMFMRNFVDASLSYTPYMWAKAETALRVDERPNNAEMGDMDKAINNLIDNTFSFKVKGTFEALGDIWYRAIHMNTHVKSREGDKPASGSPVKPSNTIDSKTIAYAKSAHDPVHLNAANENDASMRPVPKAANENDADEKRWAESVAGRKLGGQFLHSPGRLH